jgi:hypothetical protein
MELSFPRALIGRSRLACGLWSVFLLGWAVVAWHNLFIFTSLRDTWTLLPHPLSNMRGLTLLSAVSPVLALTPWDTFYPPNLNDTAYISNNTIGTYGGIYKAPTNGPTAGDPYGTYDYCFMPHPRSEEYTLPEALTKGSAKGKLVYLEYLQRHQRRSPYNILPGGEVSQYPCRVLSNRYSELTTSRTKPMNATTCARISTQAPTVQAASSLCQCMRRHTKTPPTPSRPA